MRGSQFAVISDAPVGSTNKKRSESVDGDLKLDFHDSRKVGVVQVQKIEDRLKLKSNGV